MTDTLLVSALEDSTGKTAVTLALAQIAADDGRTVGYMKPKGTRLRSQVGKVLDRDPVLAQDLLGIDAAIEEMEPIVYSSMFLEGAVRGQEDRETLRKQVRKEFDGLAADTDRMFVEGTRYTTGEIVGLADPDLASLLDASVLLVVTYDGLTQLDAVLTAADAFGDRLVGVLFNRVSDTQLESLQQDVIPFLESRGVPVVGALPEERELAGVPVSELASELGGELLCDPETDPLVERFHIGAMGGEEALRVFRRSRNAAVITGGDRADVQRAAIEAPGVTCLVVTGGHRPSPAILGEAAEAGLSVLAVDTDTLTTVERTEAVIQGGQTQDEETVGLMVTLLREYVDIDGILAGEGEE
ncbi:MAG: phosphotransacetylase family protein [Natronomonas sp.]